MQEDFALPCSQGNELILQGYSVVLSVTIIGDLFICDNLTLLMNSDAKSYNLMFSISRFYATLT